MSEVVKVKMRHVREAGMCGRGVRAFLAAHDLSWREFTDTGLDSDALEATGDAMAIEVCRVAKNGR